MAIQTSKDNDRISVLVNDLGRQKGFIGNPTKKKNKRKRPQKSEDIGFMTCLRAFGHDKSLSHENRNKNQGKRQAITFFSLILSWRSFLLNTFDFNHLCIYASAATGKCLQLNSFILTMIESPSVMYSLFNCQPRTSELGFEIQSSSFIYHCVLLSRK